MANGFMFPDQQMTPFMQAMTSPGMGMAMEAANNFQRMAQGQQVTNPVQRYQQMVMERAQQNQAMRQAEMAERQAEQGLEMGTLSMQGKEQQLNPFFEFEEGKKRGYIPADMTFDQYQQSAFRRTGPTAVQQTFDLWRQTNPNASQEQQQEALNWIIRAPQNVQVGGGGVVSRGVGGEQDVIVSSELATVRDAAAEREKAEQRAIGQSEGKKQAAATGDIKTSNKVIELIDMARTHPGREAATGASSIANPAALPGSQRRDFLTLHEQLTGNAFLMAYQQLKGGGPITDREGAVATQAQNRLNLAQTEEAYLQALDEMERDMQMLLEEAQARQEGAADIVEEVEQARTPTMRWDPQLRRVVPIGGN